MKKNLKKGFTLTELVVVIVIIGILAAVLIPTLTSYINRSRKSAAEQNAQTTLTQFLGDVLENQSNDNYIFVSEYVASHTVWVQSGNYYVQFVNGSFQSGETKETAPTDPTGTNQFGLLREEESVLTLTAKYGTAPTASSGELNTATKTAVVKY